MGGRTFFPFFLSKETNNFEMVKGEKKLEKGKNYPSNLVHCNVIV
jgi:hypothetical protein